MVNMLKETGYFILFVGIVLSAVWLLTTILNFVVFAEEPAQYVQNTTIIYEIHNETIYKNFTTIDRTYSTINVEKPMIGFFARNQRKCTSRAELVDVWGASMQPHLWDGDMTWMQPIKGREVQLGDVIMYDRNGTNIVHAVIGVYPDTEQIATAGYANAYSDNYIDYEQVLMVECLKG